MLRPSRVLVLALLLTGSIPALARPGQGAGRSLEPYRGRIVALNFWATWCAPCRSEIPLLVRIQQEYGPRWVQVIGASIDQPEDRRKAEDFARRMRINYPVWFDLTTDDMKALRLATAIPATAIFDRDGRGVFRLVGQVQGRDLSSRLEWLLGDRSDGRPPELVLPPGITPEHFAEHEAGEEEDEHHEAASREGGSAVPT